MTTIFLFDEKVRAPARPGAMIAVWRVACGAQNCKEGFEVVAPGRLAAEQHLNKQGWHRTVKLGWLCPACHQKYTKVQARLRAQRRARNLGV